MVCLYRWALLCYVLDNWWAAIVMNRLSYITGCTFFTHNSWPSWSKGVGSKLKERRLWVVTCNGNGDGLPMGQCHISVEKSTTGYDKSLFKLALRRVEPNNSPRTSPGLFQCGQVGVFVYNFGSSLPFSCWYWRKVFMKNLKLHLDLVLDFSSHFAHARPWLRNWL